MPDVSWPLVALLHLTVTAFLCGLIWVVQLVHYPLFELADRARFVEFERRHSARITGIVAVAMPLEGVLATWLVVLAGAGGPPRVPVLAGAALAVAIWACTAFVQVPCHGRLAGGFDEATHRRLVLSNWVRTTAWTARTALALWIAAAGVAG